MQIIEFSATYKHKWNDFVKNSPGSYSCHLIGWKEIIENVFGHKTFYLMAIDGDNIKGILPLVFINSRIFGKYMVSFPYLNYGGVCAESPQAKKLLLDKAIEISQSLKAQYLEIRETTENKFSLPVKTSKVCMYLDLPEHPETLWKSFKSKLRSQIRRPQKEGMFTKSGSHDQLDSFYRVFSENMRDLGTPVYPKSFFRKILDTFPENTRIITVYFKDIPVASGFLFGYREMLEIPWASSLRRYNPAAPNMLLYWEVLKFACENNYKVFDFGRSTPGSGTFKFKKQWGAKPIQLYWYYWLRKGDTLPELNPQNKKFHFAIKMWQKLPVSVTKIIGPHLIKNLS